MPGQTEGSFISPTLRLRIEAASLRSKLFEYRALGCRTEGRSTARTVGSEI